MENRLNCQVQEVVISGMNSNGRPVTSSVPQGSALVPVLLNLINELDDRSEYIASKFADDTKPGEVADAPSRGTWAGWRGGLAAT